MTALDYCRLNIHLEHRKEELTSDELERLISMMLDVDWGGNEGIYTDFYVAALPVGDTCKSIFAIAKTLHEDHYHFRLMGYFAAAFAAICKDILFRWSNEENTNA